MGFIDIHCHILPNVDDGPKNMIDAIKMIEDAYKNGTNVFVLTPHYKPRYIQNISLLENNFNEFSAKIKKLFPDVELFLGMEIMYHSDSCKLLKERKVLSIAKTKYVLIEFLPSVDIQYAKKALTELLYEGYKPILAHVERYQCFVNSFEEINDLIDLGVLIQVNSNSIVGKSTFKIKRFCRKILKNKMVHFIASDTHDLSSRNPSLDPCYKYIKKKYGDAFAYDLFIGNGRQILEKEIGEKND